MNEPLNPASPSRPVEVVAHARVAPEKVLAVLSRREVDALCNHRSAALSELFRRCALAVLSTGAHVDSARDLLERFHDFDVGIEQEDAGLRLELANAPATAFVGDQMIRGTREHLFSVLRDLVYITRELESGTHIEAESSAGITDVVFRILRNAGVLDGGATGGLAVCWGGHAIPREEYDYTKEVGYALGLRGLDVCTGCGPGAMKGPMKGATIAHAKQRINDGRYIGLTEPGIIAAEAPNPIVNALVILPDIEKRLEAFLRLGHGIVIFPGGVGTAEELLYLLGLLTHPDNAVQDLPVILTGPRSSVDYFAAVDEFVRLTLGAEATRRYQIILDDPRAVAAALADGIEAVLSRRDASDDAAYFNWQLTVGADYQTPFEATHATMQDLVLSRDLPGHVLASNLRRAFSGIVSGNVKEAGIRAVEAHGPFPIRGEQALMAALDRLLRQFVSQGRMRLSVEAYQPCYEIVT
ncbi:MAG: nucleotide 5'-monophosphate nucleosidase PpnN [Gammaproteobacteria bacterium]